LQTPEAVFEDSFGTRKQPAVMELILPLHVPSGLITPKEARMKKISYVLAALATLAVAAPALAQDKPMMKEGMDKPMMHKHHHHHHHHHMKPMMDKKM
jgi:hypothetical protein